MSVLEQVKKHKIITILRGIPHSKAADTAEALYNGGIRLLEITFDQQSGTRLRDTAEAISRAKERMGSKMLIGAGTVLTVEEAKAAFDAGAEFLLSPNTDEEVIRYGKELGMGVIPGAFTPSEIQSAHRFGADLVKVFPAGNLGVGYLRAVKAPLSHIPMIAVGGIDGNNMAEFLEAAEGVGIGANIADKRLIAEGRFSELTELAEGYTGLLKKRG